MISYLPLAPANLVSSLYYCFWLIHSIELVGVADLSCPDPILVFAVRGITALKEVVASTVASVRSAAALRIALQFINFTSSSGIQRSDSTIRFSISESSSQLSVYLELANLEGRQCPASRCLRRHNMYCSTLLALPSLFDSCSRLSNCLAAVSRKWRSEAKPSVRPGYPRTMYCYSSRNSGTPRRAMTGLYFRV